MVNFKEGDRICFLGDSITRNGGYIAEVFEYFAKTFPEKKIGIYNCGISGSRGYQFDIKNRLYCDCLNFFPTHVVIMFGMNDIGRNYYNPSDPDYNTPKIREKQISLYEDAMERMAKFFTKRKINMIICSPTPYDQYSKKESENDMCDSGLEVCSEISKKTAEKYGLTYVDMRSALLDRLYMNPIGEDRTHPNEIGHHLMAERFLHAIGVKDTEEPEKTVVLSQTNQERKNEEALLRMIMSVERDHFGMQFEKSKPISQRKKIVCDAMEQGNFLACEKYIDIADYRDEILGELVRLTEKMYE